MLEKSTSFNIIREITMSDVAKKVYRSVEYFKLAKARARQGKRNPMYYRGVQYTTKMTR